MPDRQHDHGKLAIDSEIEIPGRVFARPFATCWGFDQTCFGPERRLRADEFAFVPGFATCGLGDHISGVFHSGGPPYSHLSEAAKCAKLKSEPSV